MINQNLVIVSIVLRMILFIINIYFVTEVYKKYSRFELKVVFIIGLINIFSAFSLLIEILHLINAPTQIFTQIGTLYTFLGILVAYLLLIYLDLYENTHLNTFKFTVTTLLATFTFLMSIDGIKESIYESKPLLEAIITHISLIFIFYTLISGRITINRMKIYASQDQARYMDYVKKYVYFGFVGFSILQPVRGIIWSRDSGNYPVFEQVWVLIIPSLMLFVGNYYLYLGYIKPNQPSALSPQRLGRFIIINDEGIPIFKYEFKHQTQQIDETLLSGALSAITAVLKEATNVVGDLKRIEIGNQELLIKKYNGLTGVIFTYMPTSFLLSLLSKLMEKIGSMYQFDKYNQLTNQSFEEITNITESSFGYSN